MYCSKQQWKLMILDEEEALADVASVRNMLLSIIVPAYNVEKYIYRCIESLLNQKSNDYEVVVVNDGSTDKTAEIIEKNFKDKIIYIAKEKNTGLSDTRNVGMKAANGEYVIFVDGDDYVTKTCVCEVKEKIQGNREVDVIYLGHFEEKNGQQKKIKGFESDCNKVWTAEDFLKSELGKRNFPVPACFAVYRRKFLTENSLRFKTGIFHEDELWSAEVALKAKKVITTDICYYHYVIRAGSITQKKDLTQNGLDVILICNKMIDMLPEIKDPLLRKLFANHIAMLYMKGMCRGRLYRKQYRDAFDRWTPMKYAYFVKDRFKAVLFATSPYLYSKVDLRYGTKL